MKTDVWRVKWHEDFVAPTPPSDKIMYPPSVIWRVYYIPSPSASNILHLNTDIVVFEKIDK